MALSGDLARLERSVQMLEEQVENSRVSAAQKALAAREIRETLREVRELVPPAKAKDKVDELGDRREKRRARSPKAKSL